VNLLKSPRFAWTCAGLLVVALEFVSWRIQEQQQLRASLTEKKLQLENFRMENAEIKDFVWPTNEVAQLREENAALPGLRNEVTQLRQTNALTQTPEAQQLLAEQEQLTGQNQKLVALPPRANCIQNLEKIYQAKQQWAAKNDMPKGSLVTLKDLAEFLNGDIPECPDGGVYSPNRTGSPPICSFHGPLIPE
jgi:hypothetical protein